MKRLPGWRARMYAFVAEVGASPFAWGQLDCGPAWAGRHVELMTGVDIAAPFRGYTDYAGAVVTFQRAGFATLGDLVSSLLPELPAPSMARTGDLAAIEAREPFGHALGIVNGARILVLGRDGYGSVDLLKACRAWRVGDA